MRLRHGNEVARFDVAGLYASPVTAVVMPLVVASMGSRDYRPIGNTPSGSAPGAEAGDRPGSVWGAASLQGERLLAVGRMQRVRRGPPPHARLVGR